MSEEIYEFIRHSCCCLIVCELCRSEGVLTSDRLKKVEDKVDKLAQMMTPILVVDHDDEGDSVFAAAQEVAGSSTGCLASQSKRTFTETTAVGLPKSNLTRIVAHTITSSLN